MRWRSSSSDMHATVARASSPASIVPSLAVGRWRSRMSLVVNAECGRAAISGNRGAVRAESKSLRARAMASAESPAVVSRSTKSSNLFQTALEPSWIETGRSVASEREGPRAPKVWRLRRLDKHLRWLRQRRQESLTHAAIIIRSQRFYIEPAVSNGVPWRLSPDLPGYAIDQYRPLHPGIGEGLPDLMRRCRPRRLGQLGHLLVTTMRVDVVSALIRHADDFVRTVSPDELSEAAELPAYVKIRELLAQFGSQYSSLDAGGMGAKLRE